MLRLGRRERAEVVLPARSAAAAASASTSTGRGHQSARRASSGERVLARARGSDTSATRREARVESSGASSAATTATSSGSAAFSASAARSRAARPRPSTLATCPVAWTPASVRPATARPSQRGKTASSASRATPSTVRSPGCRAQPRNPVPSYSSVSLSVHDVTSWRAHDGHPALRPVQPRVPGNDTRDVRAHARGEPGAPQPGLDGETPIWFVTRYEDVVALLTDNERFVARSGARTHPG